MLDKIMATLAIILMVVEFGAVVFLTWNWFDAKRRNEDGKL